MGNAQLIFISLHLQQQLENMLDLVATNNYNIKNTPHLNLPVHKFMGYTNPPNILIIKGMSKYINLSVKRFDTCIIIAVNQISNYITEVCTGVWVEHHHTHNVIRQFNWGFAYNFIIGFSVVLYRVNCFIGSMCIYFIC